MAVNLSRNTKVYFTTNVDSVTGVITNSGFTAANLVELQVLSDYNFTQSTNQETIQLNEAGATPNRGQRSFNTALAPVEWSFKTYIRPYLDGGSSAITAAEKVLWNAIAGPSEIGKIGTVNAPKVTLTSISRATTTTGVCTAAGTFSTAYPVGSVFNIIGTGTGTSSAFIGQFVVDSATTSQIIFTNPYLTTSNPATAVGTFIAMGGQWAEGTTAMAQVGFAASESHQLQKFGLVFKTDNVYYYVDNCAVGEAQVDFGIDQISQIAWSGNGTVIREVTPHATFTSATAAVSAAKFITNKLTTVSLSKNIGGGGTDFNVPITGGSITISNNLQYLTPEILGIVNQPIGYFTGSRSITATLNAYLRAGAAETGGLLSDVLTSAASSPDNQFRCNIQVGGGTNSVRVDFDIPAAMLQVPTVEQADVISTTINLTAQGYDLAGNVTASSGYNIESANELVVRYYSV
jgi:hypothetical protein